MPRENINDFVARKLLVALWKYVSAGVMIEGAMLNNVEEKDT